MLEILVIIGIIIGIKEMLTETEEDRIKEFLI